MKVYPFACLPGLSLAAVKWFSIIIAVVAVVPVLQLLTRRTPAPAAAAMAGPVRSLPLTLTGEGGRLDLAWDGEAPAIQAGRCGILWIADGAIHRRVILDASQLRSGKLFYWPVNKDVSFEIKLSEGNNRSGETVCRNNATSMPQPAEGPARREQRAERTASRSRLKTVHVAQRQSIESSQSEDVSAGGNAWIESINAPAFTIEGESQVVVTLPVHAILRQAVSEEQIPSPAIMPAPQGETESFSRVTVEGVRERRLSRITGKIPLL